MVLCLGDTWRLARVTLYFRIRSMLHFLSLLILLIWFDLIWFDLMTVGNQTWSFQFISQNSRLFFYSLIFRINIKYWRPSILVVVGWPAWWEVSSRTLILKKNFKKWSHSSRLVLFLDKHLTVFIVLISDVSYFMFNPLVVNIIQTNDLPGAKRTIDQTFEDVSTVINIRDKNKVFSYLHYYYGAPDIVNYLNQFIRCCKGVHPAVFDQSESSSPNMWTWLAGNQSYKY